MSDDEMNRVRIRFRPATGAFSQKLFVERRYQLLRPGGKLCCVSPETVLDTSTNIGVRLFLLQYFRITAVVSLPYDAFRPFTSTKTCVLLATKRSHADSGRWSQAWVRSRTAVPGGTESERAAWVLRELGWDGEEVFMAEPSAVGYKRRKGLPDLPLPNELYRENADGLPVDPPPGDIDTVLCGFAQAPGVPSASFGFWTTSGAAATRNGCRLDPKYRWLWDYQNGVAWGPQPRGRVH